MKERSEKLGQPAVAHLPTWDRDDHFRVSLNFLLEGPIKLFRTTVIDPVPCSPLNGSALSPLVEHHEQMFRTDTMVRLEILN